MFSGIAPEGTIADRNHWARTHPRPPSFEQGQPIRGIVSHSMARYLSCRSPSAQPRAADPYGRWGTGRVPGPVGSTGYPDDIVRPLVPLSSQPLPDLVMSRALLAPRPEFTGPVDSGVPRAEVSAGHGIPGAPCRAADSACQQRRTYAGSLFAGHFALPASPTL